MINTNYYTGFKTYNQYLAEKNSKNTKKDYKKYFLPLVGSSLGVAAGMLATKNVDLRSKSRILHELVHLLAMAGGANFGAVALTSIGKKPEVIKKKLKEASFQMMNITIPMLMVSGANAICNKTIGKTKPVIRILASLAALALGAATATKITNETQPLGEAKRKYTIKDSVANIDELIATFNIGFEDQADLLKLDTRLMPFIYAYCGMRAGSKE